MNTNSIFISQTEANDNDISGKITYTEILDSIPGNRTEKQLPDWKKKYTTEWRWRFIRFNIVDRDNKQIEKYVAEISYIKYNSDKRIYFNRHGQWVNRTIDPAYDQFVEKQYFVYTDD
ncbi:hypothetical protein QKU48_gp0806 [Fadolivirus algeromassiliense]|jgi:hypothetical protein|uniref:Uncharacterized protein n=1 Tax=Fadolivirus FV1/VV64 TaxID=3070911 RepID=A0A7D3QVH2_9VIRU|nr:hypothetical protein QKU48_gp0806 [Fadolivirus algeromassiliense]QKF94264.1 hypothetical protein Fadolivirus_1_806 [Fadolivirus FV1/VV64]